MAKKESGIILLAIVIATAIIVVLLLFQGGLTGAAVAEGKKGKRISLEDLGWLQVAAHDLVKVNRNTGINGENGKDRKSTRLNSSHSAKSRMPSSA